MSEPRVNFSGLTAIPRFQGEEQTEVMFYATVSPARDCTLTVEGEEKPVVFKSITVNCDTMDVVEKLREVGAVKLSELDYSVEKYEDKDGEDAYSLNCTFGAVNIRGEW